MQLRKILNTLLFALIAMCLVFSLVGCGEKAGGGDTNNPTTGEADTNNPTTGGTVQGPHKIYFIDKPDGTWNIWAWKCPSNQNYDSRAWPGGSFQLTQSDDIGFYCTMELDTSSDLGILFVKKDASEKTDDIIVPKEIIQKNATLYFAYGDSNYYTSADDLIETDKNYTVDESLPPPAEGYIRINTLSTDADNLWIWSDFDSVAMKQCSNWDAKGGGYPITGTNGSFVYADIKLAENPQLLSFIVRKGTDKVSGNDDVIFIFPHKYNEIFLKKRSSTIYVNKDLTELPKGLSSATITDEKSLTADFQGISLNKDNLKICKSDGTTEVEIESISDTKITLISHNLKTDGTVLLTYTDELGIDKRTANFDSSLIDEWFFVNDTSDFGYNNGIFKTWAPLATSAKVLLFADVSKVNTGEVAEEIQMTRNTDGTWVTEESSAKVGTNKYYKYSLVNNGVKYDVSDIWSYVASPDSVASQIIDINDASLTAGWEADYVNPFGNSGTEEKLYSDAVIYEMHIRDWGKAFGSTNTGKFAEITAELGDTGKFATHLKDLGITHVQILPMFDYAQPNSDEKYNWGYNPYHYNVPEGRYVENMENGTDAVTQLRTMIKAFHDAGIAVIMDVVYNHTAGTGTGSLYDMTVPQYFYRMTANGSYSDGSGCGNEVATNHTMVAKYVIDSLVHWMEDYHINGFRFDLMGCQEQDFMTEVYETLYKKDRNVMVYGEPWTGGTAAVVKGTTESIQTTNGNGVGVFEDTFRNAIKGGEYGGFQGGHVQGTYNDTEINNGLLGKSGKNSTNGTSKPGLMLSYVECHDNYTLYDKLAISQFSYSGKNDAQLKLLWKKFADLDADKKKAVSDQNKLAAAYVFLSQGTPFINGGQEFMRDKDGDHNSYESDDTINGIDLGYKETHKDVYNVYKGLIAFRKDNSNAFGGNTSATAETVKTGVTKYTAGDYLVYFNATKTAETIDTRGYTKVVNVTSGTPTESEELPNSVPAKGFVILKK